ncbi:MAG: hypothetical protein OEZ06_14830 [Myxococcales bacterium]|nr:hypothetical protein [Myxococcales bacterium]
MVAAELRAAEEARERWDRDRGRIFEAIEALRHELRAIDDSVRERVEHDRQGELPSYGAPTPEPSAAPSYRPRSWEPTPRHDERDSELRSVRRVSRGAAHYRAEAERIRHEMDELVRLHERGEQRRRARQRTRARDFDFEAPLPRPRRRRSIHDFDLPPSYEEHAMALPERSGGAWLKKVLLLMAIAEEL